MRYPLLLAEDDASIIEVVTEILGMEGYTVIHASHEKDVIDRAKAEHPFAIFLDISLSGSDGRVIAKKLRTIDEVKNIPIIVMSADADIIGIAEKIKADDVLMKPFEIDELLQKVKKFTPLEE